MSTRILPIGSFMNFNIRMSELRRRIQPPPVTAPVTTTQPEAAVTQQPPQQQQQQQQQQARSVRRNLFGPIDHEENLKFVHEELNRIAEADARRWNFDFRRDAPLEGRFSWELAKGSEVPPAYEMPNLAKRLSSSTVTTAPSTSKLAPTTTTTSSATATAPPTTGSTNTTSTTEEKKPPPGTENSPLRSALSAVTTGATTIVTVSSKEARSSPREGKVASTLPKAPPLVPSVTSASKQTQITDFLKLRKRSLSYPETDNSSSSSKSDEALSPPVLKRARTSTT